MNGRIFDILLQYDTNILCDMSEKNWIEGEEKFQLEVKMFAKTAENYSDVVMQNTFNSLGNIISIKYFAVTVLVVR